MKGNIAMRIDMNTLRHLVGLLSVWVCASLAHGQDRALAPGLGFTRDFEAQYPLPVYSMAVHDDGTGSQLYLGGAFQNYVVGHLPFMSRNITHAARMAGALRRDRRGSAELRAPATRRESARVGRPAAVSGVWYRDPDPAFCSSGGLFNTTNGMRVEW